MKIKKSEGMIIFLLLTDIIFYLKLVLIHIYSIGTYSAYSFCPVNSRH